MKKRNEESAFSAICNAQRIACAPFEFEAARSLRDFGILAALDKAGDAGLTEEEIKAVSGLSDYAVRVLLNAAEGAGILRTESGRTSLTKTGCFLLNDPMTRPTSTSRPMSAFRESRNSPTPLGKGGPRASVRLGPGRGRFTRISGNSLTPPERAGSGMTSISLTTRFLTRYPASPRFTRRFSAILAGTRVSGRSGSRRRTPRSGSG